MGGFLFDELIFGPVRSRRLGVSLGINLLPTHRKFCSFNCIYCECGWTDMQEAHKMKLPKQDVIKQALEKRLVEIHNTDLQPNSITFAGNGEPTMHPQFAGIIDDTCRLRDVYAPNAKISVLTNGSMLHKSTVVEALKKVDNNLLKLDGGNEDIISKINLPLKAFRLNDYVEQLKHFKGKLTIQSLFLRGVVNGKQVDNTTTKEINDWLKLIKQIKPERVMVYAIERDTAGEGIEKISKAELESIAAKVKAAGIDADVFA
jgi:wyosine [tRNA(Phe)-imidazoG37] synthetase (radical SAM superfamily)